MFALWKLLRNSECEGVDDVYMFDGKEVATLPVVESSVFIVDLIDLPGTSALADTGRAIVSPKSCISSGVGAINS